MDIVGSHYHIYIYVTLNRQFSSFFYFSFSFFEVSLTKPKAYNSLSSFKDDSFGELFMFLSFEFRKRIDNTYKG